MQTGGIRTSMMYIRTTKKTYSQITNKSIGNRTCQEEKLQKRNILQEKEA